MSWAKKGEYEIALDENRDKELKKRKIKMQYEHNEAEFFSRDIPIGGIKQKEEGIMDNGKTFHRISTVNHRTREVCLKLWNGISEEIPGLHCYYCDSQGFKTDMPGVAVCGAAPGWFFFYRRIAKETKPMLKIINGKLVETTEEGVNL